MQSCKRHTKYIVVIVIEKLYSFFGNTSSTVVGFHYLLHFVAVAPKAQTPNFGYFCFLSNVLLSKSTIDSLAELVLGVLRHPRHNLDSARCASLSSRFTITPSISTCSAVTNCVADAVASCLSAFHKKKWVLHAFVFCPRVGNCRVFLSRFDVCKKWYSLTCDSRSSHSRFQII